MRRSPDQAAVARQIRTLFRDGSTADLSDRELLERFATRTGDAAEAAFASLVGRHGSMVLRACRATLGDLHEAEDAFQATFLLLARRAGSLWVRDSLGPWLHAVACRVASGKRAARLRRQGLERRFAARLSIPDGSATTDLIGPALHEEIDRLPERLKAPVVLCYLEGLTHERAADHLGCPVGTVRSRLARGRDRLRRALARRGFAPSIPAEGPVLTLTPVPSALASLTIHASRVVSDRSALDPFARWWLFLLEGVLKPMMIHPFKSAAGILLASGAIFAGFEATSGQDPKPPEATAPPAREPSADEKRFEAIERRLKEVEAELRELKAKQPPTPVEGLTHRVVTVNPPGSTPNNEVFEYIRQKQVKENAVDPNTLIKIRPRFENALVEKVFVKAGQTVKKGDPLMEIRSTEVSLAKNQCRTNFVQWDHDHKFLIARGPLAKEGRITQFMWAETQSDEKKSRLDYLVSRERLSNFGMSSQEIDDLLAGLGDDAKAVDLAGNATDISRITVVSPVDGVVVARDAAPGNFYNQTEVLLTITPKKP